MGLEVKHFESREEWLIGRQVQGIGASECAAIVGQSPWMSPTELWQIKTGKKPPRSVSNEAIAKGIAYEPVLRELFKAKHPEYAHSYHPFDLLYQTSRPYMFATLDGEFVDEDGKHGILEIKTATPNGKAGWEKWQNAVPNNYYLQLLFQMLATGYDRATLFACLFNQDGDMTIREYQFTKAEVKADMEWLLEKVDSFWNHVKNNTMPSTALIL